MNPKVEIVCTTSDGWLGEIDRNIKDKNVFILVNTSDISEKYDVEPFFVIPGMDTLYKVEKR